MSNLSKRVEKAKQLQVKELPGTIGKYAMRSNASEKHYQTHLTSHKMTSRFGDKHINHFVFKCECQESAYYHNGNAQEVCKGNERHTVCYHCLASLIFAFEKTGKHISFYGNVFDAMNGLNFGGSLAKVVSTQGNGVVWATVRKVEKKEELQDKVAEVVGDLSSEEKVNVMRLSVEESEGID